MKQAVCPHCEEPGLVLYTKRDTNRSPDETYALYYTRCNNCDTRCRTELTSAVIERGNPRKIKKVAA